MKPTDLKCYKQVVAVIGEAYADYELQRVIDCEHYEYEERLIFGFIWGCTPQGGNFWLLIHEGKNPYFHGHTRPKLSEKSHANSDKELFIPLESCPKVDVPEHQLNEKQRSDGSTAVSILEAGLGHMQDRAVTYDSPQGERSMGKTVGMFNTLYGLELTEEQGWAFMAILKLVRTSQGNFKLDNFEDMAAYSGLMGEAASKLAQTKN